MQLYTNNTIIIELIKEKGVYAQKMRNMETPKYLNLHYKQICFQVFQWTFIYIFLL